MFAEKARHKTLEALDAFQLTLKHEPWPMWVPVPVSLVWLVTGAALLALAYWRQALQRAAASGGTRDLRSASHYVDLCRAGAAQVAHARIATHSAGAPREPCTE